MSEVNTQPEKSLLPLTTIDGDGSLILPAELRRALNLKQGDALQAEVRDGGVLLRPITDEVREQAWDELMAIIDEPKWIGPGPEPSEDEVLEEANRLIHQLRQENAQGGI